MIKKQTRFAIFLLGLVLGIVSASAQSIDTSKTTRAINQTISKVLEYYPTLSYKKITFRRANISVSMQCRPTILSALFCKRTKRIYTITINKSSKNTGFYIDSLPEAVLLGLIGHEIAHIADYSQRNILQVASRGLDYCSQTRKARFEHQIDSLTIAANLGCALYRWAKYVQTSPQITPQYKAIKQKIYLSPEEIYKRLAGDTCQAKF